MEGMKKNRAREAGNGVKMGREPRGPLEGLGAEFFAEGKKFAPRPSSVPPRFSTHFGAISRETGAIFQRSLPFGPNPSDLALPLPSKIMTLEVDKWEN